MKQLFSTYQKLIGADNFIDSDINVQITGDRASQIIERKLLANEPVMIARFGATELTTILNYHFTRGNFFNHVSNIIKGIPYFSQFKKSLIHDMTVISGFFP